MLESQSLSDQESSTTSAEALSRFIVGDATVGETLHRVAELALGALGTADMAGITMLVEGRPRTAVFNDAEAPEIDAAQYETGIGPCLDAWRHQQVYRIDDLTQDRQWPPFSEAAVAHGVLSSLSLPLIAGRQGMGALNFYARRVSAFSDDDVHVGLHFATQAAIVLADSLAYWDAHNLSQDIATVMKSRATIDQARGILMATERCSAEEALQILVRASERENRTVSEIAEELVNRTRG